VTTIHLDYPLNVLMSYHYFAKVDLTEYANGGLRIIGDSGAYSAASQGADIDVDAFASWAIAQRHNLCWVASLDVIGDAAGTWRNYRRMRHERGVDVIPTVHFGAEPKALDRYAAEGIDLVGLGGMVPHKSAPDKLLRWCLSMFRYARDTHPGMRFHGWGVTHPKLLDSLPWWSVDSSGPGASYRYGRARTYDPSTGKQLNIALNGRDAHAHGELLRRHYGIDPADISRSGAENRPLQVRFSARSVQLRERWLQARHHVTPPAYGVNPDAGLGPSVHFAETDAKTLSYMLPPPVGTHMHFAEASTSCLRDMTRPDPHPEEAPT
jgi:hypothetical protein